MRIPLTRLAVILKIAILTTMYVTNSVLADSSTQLSLEEEVKG